MNNTNITKNDLKFKSSPPPPKKNNNQNQTVKNPLRWNILKQHTQWLSCKVALSHFNKIRTSRPSGSYLPYNTYAEGSQLTTASLTNKYSQGVQNPNLYWWNMLVIVCTVSFKFTRVQNPHFYWWNIVSYSLYCPFKIHEGKVSKLLLMEYVSLCCHFKHIHKGSESKLPLMECMLVSLCCLFKNIHKGSESKLTLIEQVSSFVLSL